MRSSTRESQSNYVIKFHLRYSATGLCEMVTPWCHDSSLTLRCRWSREHLVTSGVISVTMIMTALLNGSLLIVSAGNSQLSLRLFKIYVTF